MSAAHCVDREIRKFDRLFTLANVGDIPEDKTFGDYLNPDSMTAYPGAKLEMSLKEASADDRFQFVRNGYYIKDTRNSNVFLEIVGLKDAWAKLQQE